MIGWMVRNFISREANVLDIHKPLIRPYIEHCTQAWDPLSRQVLRLEYNIEIRGHKKNEKIFF